MSPAITLMTSTQGYIDSVANKVGGALAASVFGLATHHTVWRVGGNNGGGGIEGGDGGGDSSQYALAAGIAACLLWVWLAGASVCRAFIPLSCSMLWNPFWLEVNGGARARHVAAHCVPTSRPLGWLPVKHAEIDPLYAPMTSQAPWQQPMPHCRQRCTTL
jgi:hypothetical protein